VGDGGGDALDVGGQGCVELDVVGGVLADDVDDAGAGLLGVVEVGDAVGEAGAEVEKGRGGPAGHAVIAVRGAGDAAFEEAERTAHAGDCVEGRHEVHLGGAGVGETDVDTTRQQRADEAFGSVHWARFRRFASSWRNRRTGGAGRKVRARGARGDIKWMKGRSCQVRRRRWAGACGRRGGARWRAGRRSTASLRPRGRG
jgi:hypothetical protein